MLAPILAFTADEAWEFVPGQREAFVHASVWEPGSFQPTDAERQLWSKLFLEREQALAELEKARQSKLIGKALEAKVVRVATPELQAQLVGVSDDLRELLNVSQLEWQSGAEPAFRIERASGQKCDRCWHWETDLGADPAHPGLCGRCARAVKG